MCSLALVSALCMSVAGFHGMDFVKADSASDTQTVASADSKTANTDTVEDILEEQEKEYKKTRKLLDEKLSVNRAKGSFDGMDENLKKAVLDAYNTGSGTNKMLADFTPADLQQYTGELVLKGELTGVQSLEGLDNAVKASKIDISACIGITEIPANFFADAEFSEFVMPDSIAKIGDRAFQRCKNLEEIDLPKNLTSLGAFAFASCEKLVSVNVKEGDPNTLPDSLTSIGEQTFSSCAIETIVIPSYPNGEILPTSMFALCTKLTKIQIGSSITTIPVTCFASAGRESAGVQVTFDSSPKLKKILSEAFKSARFSTDGACLDLSTCSELEAITSGAFMSSEGLTSVLLPKTTSNFSLGDNAFAKSNIQTFGIEGTDEGSVVLPDYVTSVGAGCFFGDTGITAVTLPDNAEFTILPDYLFDGCTKLAEVSVPENSKVKEIGDCAFRQTAVTSTAFLLKMKELEVIGYQRLTKEQIDGKDKRTYGVAYRYDNPSGQNEDQIASLPLGGETSTNKKIDIKDNIKKYDNKYCGSEVFSGCANLTEIKLPASVTEIGARAFYFKQYSKSNDEPYPRVDPEVTSLEWETAATGAERHVYIGAFQGNKKMTSIQLPDGAGDKLSLGAYAFAADVELASVNADSKGNNVLPKSVSEIGRGAFFFCSELPNITISSMSDGECPVLEPRVFEKCLTMTKAVLPAKTTEIPDGMFYDVPLESFEIAGNPAPNSVTRIGELAFAGNMIPTLDLSGYANIKEIDSGAFAYANSLINPVEKYDIQEQSLASTTVPALKKVILPADLEALALSGSCFYFQGSFDTMEEYGNVLNQDEVLLIPDYVSAEKANMCFGDTGVKEACWEADSTGKGQWTKICTALFVGCPVKDGDVRNLLPGTWTDGQKYCSYLTEIEKAAFFDSSVNTVDLRGYTALTKIGSGTSNLKTLLPLRNPANGVFDSCPLQTVKLPDHGAAIGADGKPLPLEIMEETFREANYDGDGSVSYDLGSATAIGEKAFYQNASIETIEIPEGVALLGTESFSECENLTNVGFGKVETIGQKAFAKSPKLKFSKSETANYALPVTLKTIGNEAFSDCTVLGEAEFGNALTSIGQKAFQKSGLSKVTFNSPNLATIGQSAFSYTNIPEFILENAKVKVIETHTFEACKNLVTASFGPELMQISKDAIMACPAFKTLRIYDYTTVSPTVFSSKVQYQGENLYTAANNKGSITMEVKAVNKDIIVPINQEIKLPYYVSQHTGSADFTAFHYVLSGEGETDQSVSEKFKVRAKLGDGYYWSKKTEGYRIQDSQYFENQSVFEQRTENGFTLSPKDIERISITGLDYTDDKGVALKVVGNANFEIDSAAGYSISVAGFETDYTIHVKNVPFHADVYTGSGRKEEELLANDKSISFQSQSANNSMRLFYDIKRDVEVADGITPDTYDLVIETSDPAVVYPALNSGDTAEKLTDGKYVVREIPFKDGKPVQNLSRQDYYLKYVGRGEADITVYPKGHPDWAKTFHYVVDSDLRNITLKLPETYTTKDGTVKQIKGTVYFNQGDTFKLSGTCTTWLESKPFSLADYTKYTNRKIIYELTDEKNKPYLSIGDDGTITILQNDVKRKNVSIIAKAVKTSTNPAKTDYVKSSSLSINLEANTSGSGGSTGGTTGGVTVNQQVTDKTTGATVQVVKTSTKDLEGEVKYVAPAAGKTDVVVPDTVTVNGVRYKVTTVPTSAFKGNTTIKTVKIGAYVTTIEKEAFSGCTALTTVTIPDSVVTIGAKAFYNCKKLVTVNLSKNSKLKVISNSAFYNCAAMTKIVIPDAVTKIDTKAFYGCKKLKTVTISTKSKLTQIGSGAFQKCAAITKITLPSKMKKLGTNAFRDCKKLKTITVKSSSMKSVGKNAFKNIHKKATIKVPKKKLASYKKWLKKKGQAKTVKIKK